MNKSSECWAVIPAAGIGQRMKLSTPKQYLEIQGKTILEYAAQPLLKNNYIKKVIFALHADDDHFARLSFDNFHEKIHTVTGGETRAHSVLNALDAIQNDIRPDAYVLVHDAARPCLSEEDLANLIAACATHEVGGILGAPVTDTVKHVQQHTILGTLDREHLWCAFTPQMFKFKLLYQAITQALQSNAIITDEASAMEKAGYQPCIVQGNLRNIKVTHAEDIATAEAYLTLLNHM